MSIATNASSTSSLDLIGVDHEDGDIVLVAGERQDQPGEEMFRVHRAIVCLPSAVFKDMVNHSCPDERIDGRPVIRCYDSASDLRMLLSALYNGLSLLQENHLTLDIALSILLLSNKYCVDGLRRGIVQLLQEEWPLNYSDYLARRTRIRNPECRVIESMKLIHCAQRCEEWELLPAAFYEVSAIRAQDWSEEEIYTSQRYLSQNDFSRLLVGKERATQRLEPFARWDEENWVETSPKMWNRDRAAMSLTINEARRSKSQGFKPCTPGRIFCPGVPAALKSKIAGHLFTGMSPFAALGDLKAADFKEVSPCEACVDWLFHMVIENKTQEMWENFPADFDLPRIDRDRYAESIFKLR